METFERITLLRHRIEAGALEAALMDQEIPFRLHSFHDAAYDGLFQAQKGWGCIEAPPACREAILEVLEGIREAVNEAEDAS